VSLAVILFLAWGGVVYAQNSLPGQLGAEIQSLEQKLSSADISPVERHDALTRLARLRQLSGNIAGAATNWLEAATINPGDDSALIAAAYCLTAIGEWERASSAIRPLLASGRWGPLTLEARYLDACLKSWSSVNDTKGAATNGDASALADLAGNPEFISLRPLIYYTLWQTMTRNPDIQGAGNAEQWKSRLLAEFPNSPEARVINPGKAGTSISVSAVQSPLWLLLPGTTGSALAQPPKPAGPVRTPVSTHNVTPAAPPVTTPVAPASPPVKTPAPGVENTASTIVLQTGVFGKEANARAKSEALQKAGFPAIVSRKLINGAEHWAVTVPAGQDAKKTMQELKKAGFDSFPVK
jgi:cell division septation protein DedD